MSEESPAGAGPDSTLVYRAVRVRLALLAAGLTVVAVVVLVGLALNARAVADFLGGSGIAVGPVTLLAIALLTPALVSAGLLAGAAGYALGVPAGFAVGLAGLTLGGLIAVGLVRAVGAPEASRALGGRVAGLAAWLEARPSRSIVFARLLPGMPFGYVSYAYGLTSISMRRIAAAGALGFAPRCFVYTALGGSVRNLDSPQARAAIAATVAIALGSLFVPRFCPVFDTGDPTKRERRFRWTN
jgi:uncharacterized membrane protein YdjX (TVP38/TMEM64 family)